MKSIAMVTIWHV